MRREGQTLPPQFVKVLRYTMLLKPVPVSDLLADPDRPQLVSIREFSLFLMRFGPLRLSFMKSSSSFFDGASYEMVPWFHGSVPRAKASPLGLQGRLGELPVRRSPRHQLAFAPAACPPVPRRSPARCMDGRPGLSARITLAAACPLLHACRRLRGAGSFLVRFSEHEPKSLTLAYVRQVEENGVPRQPPQLEDRFCLIHNAREVGASPTCYGRRTCADPCVTTCVYLTLAPAAAGLLVGRKPCPGGPAVPERQGFRRWECRKALQPCA